MSESVLSYRDVNVTYGGQVWASRDVSLEVGPRECLALVGESGCGKSTLARAALGLLPSSARVTGSIRVNGTEVVGASKSQLRALRGRVVGYVAQDPYGACDPLRRVEHHVAEAWRVHREAPPTGAVVGALERLGIPEPARRARQFPHQWSGGMLQRATIAAADAHHPPLVIADEPTSALDADRAHSTLEALRGTGVALLLVSHDISVVGLHADRVAVLYGGRVVELGDAAQVLAEPRHQYTRSLLASIPGENGRLPEPLPGRPANLRDHGAGCPFAPRCKLVHDRCHAETPTLWAGVACHLFDEH